MTPSPDVFRSFLNTRKT